MENVDNPAADVENIHEFLDIKVAPPKGWKFVDRPNIVIRQGWLPRLPKKSEPFTEAPIKHIIFTYNVGRQACTDHRACLDTVKAIQRKQMDEDMLPDIAYNFLVGSDGKIYECRGFGIIPEKNPQFPELYGKSLEIGFISDDANKVPKADFVNIIRFINHAIYITKDIHKQYRIYESEPRFFINSAFGKTSSKDII